MLDRYRKIRQDSADLAAPLEPEDMVVQTMPDVSPTKWHLAHVSWFFETFVLAPHAAGYRPHHPQYGFLFNSYYQTVGQMHARPTRGLLSRPTVREVMSYRAHVDEHMSALLERGVDDDLAYVIDVGLNHEQQHQELALTDIKHVFSQNPLRPAYRDDLARGAGKAPALEWIGHAGGVVEVGHDGSGFSFDNEGPRHEVLLRPFELASRPVTCGEYLAFMADGGYERPELWLSQGWEKVTTGGWRAPCYWEQQEDGDWHVFTLGGLRPVVEDEPVCHLSYLEADAYARWADARLPGEHEWEVVAREHDAGRGNFVGRAALHPAPAAASGLTQLFGDVWEWTQSPYQPYPGFRPGPGALGEYNGKFMCSQMVLKGGACTTPDGHVRATYRNFFYPPDRWQMTGVRLARDA